MIFVAFYPDATCARACLLRAIGENPGFMVGGAEAAALHQWGGNRSLPTSGRSLEGAPMPQSYKGEPILSTSASDTMDSMEL